MGVPSAITITIIVYLVGGWWPNEPGDYSVDYLVDYPSAFCIYNRFLLTTHVDVKRSVEYSTMHQKKMEVD
jgi:hypothetical protein